MKSLIFFLALLFARPAHTQLLQQSDLEYLGAFQLPTGTQRCGTLTDVINCYSYGGAAIVFNPANNSLFYNGHNWHPNYVSEIGIPPIVNTTTFSTLQKATVLQPFVDVYGGLMNTVDAGSVQAGGFLVSSGRLTMSAYSYYDGDGSQTLSHFFRSTNLTSGVVNGAYRVTDPTLALKSGFFSNYMTPIPQAWQSVLGGKALTGGCCMAVISRTSYGPSAFAFNPENLGVQVPLVAQPLLYYNATHTTLGPCAATSATWNCTSEIHGIVFPEGSNSVLFFGKHGIGPYCYGTGAACNDPAFGGQGVHAYPYIYQVWAYDAAEFAKVKQGLKQPWEVVPYAVWQLNLPFGLGQGLLGGVAYDPTTQRLFVVQQYAQSGGTQAIHVFNVHIPPPPIVEADFTIITKEGRTIIISRQPMTPKTSAVLAVDPSMNVIVNGEVVP